MKVYDFDLMAKLDTRLSLSFDICNVCEHWSLDILSLLKHV